MINCFKNNGVGFTIRNINLDILNEGEQINNKIPKINMILYQNHCYQYKNMDDI